MVVPNKLPTAEQHGTLVGPCRLRSSLSRVRASLPGRSSLDVNTSSVAGLFHLVRPRFVRHGATLLTDHPRARECPRYANWKKRCEGSIHLVSGRGQEAGHVDTGERCRGGGGHAWSGGCRGREECQSQYEEADWGQSEWGSSRTVEVAFPSVY